MPKQYDDRDNSGRGCLRYLFGLILVLILAILFVIFVIPLIMRLGVSFNNIVNPA